MTVYNGVNKLIAVEPLIYGPLFFAPERLSTKTKIARRKCQKSDDAKTQHTIINGVWQNEQSVQLEPAIISFFYFHYSDKLFDLGTDYVTTVWRNEFVQIDEMANMKDI